MAINHFDSFTILRTDARVTCEARALKRPFADTNFQSCEDFARDAPFEADVLKRGSKASQDVRLRAVIYIRQEVDDRAVSHRHPIGEGAGGDDQRREHIPDIVHSTSLARGSVCGLYTGITSARFVSLERAFFSRRIRRNG